MNDLDRRLIELNDALLNLVKGIPLPQKVLDQAQLAIAGQINTGSGNDVVIINEEECDACPPGPQGEKGEKGEKGDPGECSCLNKCIGISEDYTVTPDDFYIGVNSDGPVTVTLPCDVDKCLMIVIKAEMGPPLGNRKVTIKTSGSCKIDGEDQIVFTVPYESATILFRDGNWHVISNTY